jgi:hypothetical protein
MTGHSSLVGHVEVQNRPFNLIKLKSANHRREVVKNTHLLKAELHDV